MTEIKKESHLSFYIKNLYPLVVIAVFFGLLLGVTFMFLNPVIQKTAKREELAALKVVITKGKQFELQTNGSVIYYQATDKDKNIVGYVFKEGNIGYGGPVVTLIGVTNGAVDSIFILSADLETPGLGYKCMEKNWQKQFKGLTLDHVPASKSDFKKYGLSAITGATYSSMAVANNIRDALKHYQDIALKGGKDGK